MDGSNKPCFQSVVILGLKTALLEAQDEINRLTKERDEARKKMFQMIQMNGKFQVEVIKSNELATKLKTELKKVRKELEDHKIKLGDMREENEREHVNWAFKCNELKSLLDIKTELLESLNIKGDRANKDETIDYRANYKILMRNLKMIIKNRLCFPDIELIEDIRNMILKIESGKSIILSKYLAKKIKSTIKKPDECYNNGDEKSPVEILDDSRDQISNSASLPSCVTNTNYNCSENHNSNSIQHNSTKFEDLCFPNSNTSKYTNFIRGTTEICDQHQNKSIDSVIASHRNDEKYIDTISDSESDSTSGFCDGETEVESPLNTELANQSRSTPSPENHTFAMCMPDLLSSNDTEKNKSKNEFSTKKDVNDSNTISKLSDSILNSKPRNNIKSLSPQKSELNFKNTDEVQNILKEMDQMRNSMIDKLSSLKQFYDDNLVEMNNCFKRPKSVTSSQRKSVQKGFKSIEDSKDFIPKRSSQLVKRDPCSKKLERSAISSAIGEASSTESNNKLNLGSKNTRNKIQEDSFETKNLASKVFDLDTTKNLEVCEISSLENSSSLSNVTSCFEKPIETATESLTQVPSEIGVRDMMDLKAALNESNIPLSDDEVAVKEVENTQISSPQTSVNEANHSTDCQRAELLENLRENTLIPIELVTNLSEQAKPSCIKTPPDIVTAEENDTSSKEFIDNISSEKSSSCIDENLDQVSTKKSNETEKQFIDIASSSAEISNDKLTSTINSMNQSSVEQASEFCNMENKDMKETNFYFTNEKLIKTALKNDKSPFKTTKLKHVSFSDEHYSPATCLNNYLAENDTCSLDENAVSKGSLVPVQEPAETPQKTGISITANDVDIGNRSNADLETTMDKYDPSNAPIIAKKCVNLSVSKPKKNAAVSRKFVPEKEMQINSLSNSNATEEKVLEKVLKKRGRPKKASLDLQSEDNLPKTADITEQQDDLCSSKRKINIAISQNSKESCIPEIEAPTNSLIECDFTEDKILEKVVKKRGRPKKASLDLQSEDLPKTVDNSKPKVNIAISENSNESWVPESETLTDSLIECDFADEEVLEKPLKKGGRRKKLKSTDLRLKKNKIISKTSNKSPVSEKRKCGRTKKASPVTKTELQNTHRETDNQATTRSLRRRCSDKAITDEVNCSNIMKNGMERRKRRGKYPDILDSLRSRSKRRKSDYDFMSLELIETAKPKQNRGRKRKTSLPLQTFDCTTQTNWSLRSESAIPQNINYVPEVETSNETTPEPEVFLAESPQQNIKSNQQINQQSSPVKINTGKSIEMKKLHETSNIVAPSETCTNPANCSLLPPCHLVTPSGHNLLHQLINDMSKIIQEKVSSIVMEKVEVLERENSGNVESKCDPIKVLNRNDTSSFDKKNISESSLKNTNLPEAIPVTVKPQFVSNTNELQAAISVAKSKEERVSCSQNLSRELENNEESISKPSIKNTDQPKVTPVKKLQKYVSNSPNSSPETEKDVQSLSRPEAVSVTELQQKQVPSSLNSSMKTDNDDESVSNSSVLITNKSHIFSREILNEETNRNSSSESETDESITKTSIRAINPVEKLASNLSSESQSDGIPLTKSSTQTTNRIEGSVTKLEPENVFSSTAESKNDVPSCAKSIFDCEDDKSPIKIACKKISSPVTQQVSTECKDIDSDDDPPVEISSKVVVPAGRTRRNPVECRYASETRYEEEVSNSSSLSSQVSELDANIELISQYENVRTPPTVKNLFDSSDDENSKCDAFTIIEEMTSVSRCLFQRQKEFAEFSRSSSPPSKSKAELSSGKSYLYSRSGNKPADEMQIKDEDDSEDETLVIAEDDHQVNDSIVDGIEINKFNFHDMNNGYASPPYAKSLKPSSSDYGQFSNQITNPSRTKLDNNFIKPKPKMIIENENQNKASNPIRFQFYKENVQLEDNDGAPKALSPFDSIWDTLKSMYVKSAPMDDDVLLIPSYQSVIHLAFFYRNRRKDSKRDHFKIEHDKIQHVEQLIGKYLENVRENEYVAVKNFKLSVNANSITIAISLTNTVLKISNHPMTDLKQTLGYLSNLCFDLESDHKEFLSTMQTSLKKKMFSKSWVVEKNSDTNQVTCIIAMSVLFTMLSQRSNNVQSVKDLLLEGLCSWKYRAHPVAFGVLNACPTIFNGVSRNCLLTQVILFTLINHSMEHNLKLYKVHEVREMIGQHYKVKLGDKAAEDYVKEAMLLYNDDTWVDAVVLLCKRKQFAWAYTNVIMKYLIQIVNKWKECDFNEMILIKTIQALHKIVQSCPMKSVNNSNKTKETQTTLPKYPTYNIGSIIKSLSELLDISKGSRLLQETVAIAICNISHLNFEYCSKILSQWQPPEGTISNQTLEEMNEIMKRFRIVAPNVPNKWLQIILPRDSIPKKYKNKRNFIPRIFEHEKGDLTPLHQKKRQLPPRFPRKNSTTSEPPKKKKKKNKSKGKKNGNSREQSIQGET